MAKENETAQTVAVDVKKKHRRGVSNETQAVSQLQFHEKDAAQNGLFIGHLESVSVDWSVNADGRSFAGMKVPRLTMHFQSNHTNASERRNVYQTLFPQESNIDTIPGGTKEWQVNNVLNWIKHVLDVFYLKGREMTPAEEEALTLDFEDYDENNQYVAVEPEDVIAGYTTLFTNAADILNGQWNLKDGETAKPCYKNADGSIIPVWMKLLRYKRVKNEWRANGQNGSLAFDPFIGTGAIELVRTKGNVTLPPIRLRLDITRESITPKEVKKAPDVGIPGQMVPGAGTVIASGMPANTGAPVDTAYIDASSDMPF